MYIYYYDYYILDVLYTTIDRTTSQTLPVSMTLVDCQGSEERFINCSYHVYTDNQDDSMDIVIYCDSNETSVTNPTNVFTVSHSVAMIYACSHMYTIIMTIIIGVCLR